MSAKKPLDLVQPRRAGRASGARGPARALGQPVPDQLRLVRGVVVHHEMDVEVSRHGLASIRSTEAAELGRAVARVALADDAPRRHVQCRKQAGRAVAACSRGCAARPGLGAWAASSWLRSSAWIWLFSSTQRTSARVRRGHVEAHHVAHLCHEVRIGRELERLQPVRLQAERPPDALHGGHRQPHSPAPCRANSSASRPWARSPGWP